MICEPAILSFWKCAYCSQTAVARFRFHWKTTNGFWTNKIRHHIILHHDLSDWVLQSGYNIGSMRELLKYLWRQGLLHRCSQDFSNEWWEGRSHCVEQRALQCLPPEYCRLFSLKKEACNFTCKAHLITSSCMLICAV